MFKWFRDARYSEVLITLKSIVADMQLLDNKIEQLRTQVNSLRSTVNRVKFKAKDEEEGEEDDQLSAAEREFIAGLAPHEQARLKRK